MLELSEWVFLLIREIPPLQVLWLLLPLLSLYIFPVLSKGFLLKLQFELPFAQRHHPYPSTTSSTWILLSSRLTPSYLQL